MDSEIVQLKKQYPLYHIDGHGVPILKYAGKGKPGPLAKQVVKGYRLKLVLESRTEGIEAKSGQGIPFSKGPMVHGGLGILEIAPPHRGIDDGYDAMPVEQRSAEPNAARDLLNHGRDWSSSFS